jgi:hypothetical protein
MKLLSIIAFCIFLPQTHANLINSVWGEKITKTASNALTFKANGLVLEYNSELDYAFHSSYKLSGDTVTISGKDDSHSEDHGKINSYWVSTYIIRGSGLYMIKNKVSFRGKWKVYTNKNNKIPDYKKVR